MKSNKEMAEAFVKDYKKRLELEKEKEEVWKAAIENADADESNEALQDEVSAAYKEYMESQAQTNVYARFALDYAIKANLI